MSKKTLMSSKNIKSGLFSQSGRVVKIVGIILGLIGLLVLGFALIPQPYYRDGFRTLAELQEYAGTLDEWIKMDGKNVIYATYESYYKNKFTQTLPRKIKRKIQNLLHFLHLKKDPIFSESFFETILNQVIKTRQAHDLKDSFIQKIDLDETSKVIVFGPVQGAFHGLIRYLEKLNDLGIIDENLKLISPDYYMVFTGDVVNRSPYTLEIFSIILKLLLVNPANIIYLKGPQEFPDNSTNHSLDRELEYRAYATSKSEEILKQETEKFFNTLPIVLYCTTPSTDHTKLNYFKISPFINDENLKNLVQESRYSDFLEKKNNEIFSILPLSGSNDHEIVNKNMLMKAIITGIKKRDHYEEMDGLRLLPPINGVISWTVLSTAAETYRIGFNFFYDAFVIISQDPKQEYIITLYNRDVRDQENKSFKTRTYNFFSGEQLS